MSVSEKKSNQILEKTYRFSHKAMATEFEIFIYYDDKHYSYQAAQEAFSELDRLELELSRFIENSDISRINNLEKGQITQVSLDAFECLKQCKELFYKTNGAFDVTIGNFWKAWLNKDKSLRNPSVDEIKFAKENTGMQFIELDENNFTVKLRRSPMAIDLGGFGKGYALDKMAEVLIEWEIDRVLLQGGRSSALALKAPDGLSGWPITLSNPFSKQVIKELFLKNRAVSGSGLQKGQHIIDPRIGKPIEVKKAAWAITLKAALSDALSTAFMVMSEKEIDRFCKDNKSVGCISLEKETNKIFQFGI